MKESEQRTAFLISGGGSTAAAVIQEYRSGALNGFVPMVVIATNVMAGKEVKAIGVDPIVVRRQRGKKSAEQFGAELNKVFHDYGIGMVALLGCLAKIPENTLCFAREHNIPMWNMHPGATDPGRADFGGMHGGAVLAACLLYHRLINAPPVGVSTTHFVTEEYDTGDIIRTQEACLKPIPDEEYSDDKCVVAHVRNVQRTFLPTEHQNVIKTARMFTSGPVCGWKREKPLIPDDAVPFLVQAKERAVQLFPNG